VQLKIGALPRKFTAADARLVKAAATASAASSQNRSLLFRAFAGALSFAEVAVRSAHADASQSLGDTATRLEYACAPCWPYDRGWSRPQQLLDHEPSSRTSGSSGGRVFGAALCPFRLAASSLSSGARFLSHGPGREPAGTCRQRSKRSASEAPVSAPASMPIPTVRNLAAHPATERADPGRCGKWKECLQNRRVRYTLTNSTPNGRRRGEPTVPCGT